MTGIGFLKLEKAMEKIKFLKHISFLAGVAGFTISTSDIASAVSCPSASEVEVAINNLGNKGDSIKLESGKWGLLTRWGFETVIHTTPISKTANLNITPKESGWENVETDVPAKECEYSMVDSNGIKFTEYLIQ